MPPQRITWIDAGKSISVLFVVIMHATIYAYAPFVGGGVATFWRVFNDATWPFQLAPLYLLSGILRPWLASARLFERRTLLAIASSLWLYAIWYLIYVAFRTIGLNSATPSFLEPIAIAREFLVPHSVLWFLLGLAAWTAVTPLMRSFSTPMVVTGAILLSASAYFLPFRMESGLSFRIFTYGAFFIIGVRLREPILRWTEGLARDPMLVALTLFAFTSFLRWHFPRDVLGLAATFPVWIGSASIILLYTARFVSRAPGTGVALEWIGRRTLPIYVLHPVIFFALASSSWWRTLITENAALRWLAPLLLTVIAVGAAVGLHEALRPTPLRILFDTPWRARTAAVRRSAGRRAGRTVR